MVNEVDMGREKCMVRIVGRESKRLKPLVYSVHNNSVLVCRLHKLLIRPKGCKKKKNDKT
jgi:hypothetical protein